MPGHGDLITLDLKVAFREPGCPLCRLRYQAEHRYLLSLLREHVNDGATRRHIVPALGFCPTHAWYVQRLEAQIWEDGLGVGILYEDLLRHTLDGIDAYIEMQRHKARQAPRWWWRLRNVWLRLFAGSRAGDLPFGLAPRGVCRACAIGQEQETTHLIWLIKRYPEASFRSLYESSDGLCLPHLRRALLLAEERDANVALLLAQDARRRILDQRDHLSQYIRKHGWQHREEPHLSEEARSWVRAVAFYAGERREEP